ncbi:3-HAO-domain-containing protein [Massarina eburnea CBS 473.64]|uniref:3-hydroxyanthranilate 3,4-dioxygenase n=1 Tax=Massarina eburnea CBS 473.64 TaxID=1395130 RepID=A0A6A6RLN4_9PLEO|nr:3-HAO-domain-containing protein [Massarina eburnea CBS 473.64]
MSHTISSTAFIFAYTASKTPSATEYPKMVPSPIDFPTISSRFSHGAVQRLILDRLSENSHLLQPPVNNYCVYNDPLTIMIVGGPNARTDYHINETPEWFYQYKGSMLLKIVDDGQFRDVHINEGDMFLLPANIPHNPVRFANTVGIVMEQPRPKDSLDRLRWYCQECGEKVHEKAFHCTDLGSQIKEGVEAFKADKEARTCKGCGTLCDTAPKPSN